MGTLFVVPQGGLRQHIENMHWGQKEEVEAELQTSLIELFSFPMVALRNHPEESDLVLDVAISKIQKGSILFGENLLFFWRPKVMLVARLYQINSNNLCDTYSVCKSIDWKTFLKKVTSPRVLFGLAPFVSTQDIQRLFYTAAVDLLKQVNKDI